MVFPGITPLNDPWFKLAGFYPECLHEVNTHIPGSMCHWACEVETRTAAPLQPFEAPILENTHEARPPPPFTRFATRSKPSNCHQKTTTLCFISFWNRNSSEPEEPICLQLSSRHAMASKENETAEGRKTFTVFRCGLPGKRLDLCHSQNCYCMSWPGNPYNGCLKPSLKGPWHMLVSVKKCGVFRKGANC